MIPEFDKIFVVSDLHLGGPKGRQAFRETDALVKLIDFVRTDPAPRVALVLNGDVVDFLAIGPDAVEFNIAAESALQAIANDVRTKPIFDALGRLVRTKAQRFLVVQLGNHDIELALPAVQGAWAKSLGASAKVLEARMLLKSDGKGWLCKVGPRLVQVVHGNHCDPWNVVDHGGLQTAAEALTRGASAPAPKTNAGTTMVINVLNPLKVKYPFVDLLKPEDAPLMAVMTALDLPTSYRGLAEAMLARLPQGQWGELLGLNGGVSAEPALSGPEADLEQFLLTAQTEPAEELRDLLENVEKQIEMGERVRRLVPDEDERLRSLGNYTRVHIQRLRASMARRLAGTPDAQSLRKALKDWLARDTSFNTGRLAPIDLQIIDSAPHGVDLVIAGHTHLPRHQAGAPEYINTGTWMRVLKLTDSPYLESDTAFKKFFAVIGREHTLADLDALKLDPRTRPVAVVDARTAALYSVTDGHGAALLKSIFPGVAP